MHFGNTFVIATEEGDEVLREIMFVAVGQRAHDAEIERDIAAIAGHLDIARMHVGMKKSVAKNLCVKNLHTVRCQLGDIHARAAQAFHLIDRRAIHSFHHHDPSAAKVPIHLGDQQQPGGGEIALELAGIGCLAGQIQLVAQIFLELVHHQFRLETATIRPELFHQIGGDF